MEAEHDCTEYVCTEGQVPEVLDVGRGGSSGVHLEHGRDARWGGPSGARRSGSALG